jgi:hypothetical protein
MLGRSRDEGRSFGRCDHRFEVADFGRVGVDLRGHDDLVLVADGLGVVALHVAARRVDVSPGWPPDPPWVADER